VPANHGSYHGVEDDDYAPTKGQGAMSDAKPLDDEIARIDYERLLERAEAAEARVKGLEQELANAEAELDRQTAIDVAVHKDTDALLRAALGPEAFNRLWGSDLERLGDAVDAALARAREMTEELEALRGLERYVRNYEMGAKTIRARLVNLDALRAKGAR
jgi:hypothetical protein